MSNQTEDDDDDFGLRRDIVREVEEAFANVPYPGDDKLLRYPHYYENHDVIEWFCGKHWKEISPRALRVNEINLHLFTPEAFRFYLPSYIVGALLHSEETHLVWESVFYNLAPGHCDKDYLTERANLLDARQKAAVRRYVELYVQTETSLPDPRKEQALAFWRSITESTNPNGRDRDER